MAEPISELQADELRLAHELENAVRLQHLSGLLIEEDAGQELIEPILDAAVAIMRADFGSIQSFDDERNELRLIGWRHFHPDSARYWEVVTTNSGTTCGAALRHGGRVVIPDVSDPRLSIQPEVMAHFRLSGIAALQSTPLTTRNGRLIGMISTHWRETQTPGERELRLLDILARQAADYIDRRRTLVALRESNVRFQSIANLVPDLIWSSRPDGSTDWYNQRWWEYTGQTIEQATGWGWTDAIHPDDREGSARRYREAVESGTLLVQEHRILRHDGEYRWFLVRAEPVRDPAGNLTMFGSATDIHDQRTMIAAVRESEEKYRILFESMDEAYAVVEVLRDGRTGEWSDFLFLEVNPAFVKHTGMEYPVGKTATQLLGTPNPRWAEVYGRVAETGEPVRLEEREPTLDRVFDLYIFRMGGPESRRVAVLFTNITERRAAEAAVRASEDRLQLALAIGGLGTWDWDIRANRIVWNDDHYRMQGYAVGEVPPSFEAWVARVHPEDREETVAVLSAARDNRELYIHDFRSLHPDGSVHWLSARGRFFYDDAGEPYRMVGVMRNITQQRTYEEALRRAKDELEARVAERTEELETAFDSLEAEMGRRRDLARQLATAQEDERRRVARDLHDTVGQLMAGLSLAFKSVEASGDLPPSTLQRLSEAKQVMNDLGKEIHGLAVRLRPTSLDDIGLKAALGQLVSEWSTRAGMKAELQTNGLDSARLSSEVETTLYRVVQEAINNVAKHARADSVSVIVTVRNGYVSLAVDDNGIGFNAGSIPKGRLGLLGMRERVELVGGEIDFESRPGSGTTVLVRIPLN